MKNPTATRITIRKSTGVGILTRAADGKWDISLNGQSSASAHYTQDQIDKIVAKAIADGATVTQE